MWFYRAAVIALWRARSGATAPGVKVILMSGHSENTVLLGAKADHNTSFLQKPFSAQMLIQKVTAALGHEQ